MDYDPEEYTNPEEVTELATKFAAALADLTSDQDTETIVNALLELAISAAMTGGYSELEALEMIKESIDEAYEDASAEDENETALT